MLFFVPFLNEEMTMSLREQLPFADEINLIIGQKVKKTPEQLAEEARKAEAEKQKREEDPTTILRR